MIKFVTIFSLILFAGGIVFAQEEPLPWEAEEVDPGLGAVGEERTVVDVLRAMFPQATIEVDPITSTLIVKAPPSLQERIEEMIKRLDVYHPQITIEAKFVELTVTDINELGIDTDIANFVVRKSQSADVDIITTWADTDTGFPEESGAWELWYTRLSNTAFQSVLRALEKVRKVNVLSAPRVTTLNGQRATIEITRNIPYVDDMEIENVGTSGYPIWLTTYTIQERDAGVYLEVTPSVPEGSTLITLDIKPTVRVLVKRVDVFSEVESEYGWPVIDRRTTTTSMIVNSGESIVLGGLIKNEVKVIEKKIPLLGDIPLLGRAFRHKYSTDEKKNLLIFITAYLVSPQGERIGGNGTS